MNEMSKCPVMHGSVTTPKSGTKNVDWWPNSLNLDILRQQIASLILLVRTSITRRL